MMRNCVLAVALFALLIAAETAFAAGAVLPDIRRFEGMPGGLSYEEKAPTPAETKQPPSTISIPGFTVTLGTRQSFIECWTNDLLCTFPDTALSFLAREPDYIRLFIVASPNTWLMEGPDMNSLVIVGDQPVLTPGDPGEFDNAYAGVFGIHRVAGTDEILCFYHGEDSEGIPQAPGQIPPAHWFGLGMAVSTDNGLTLNKMGQIISSYEPKDPDPNKAMAGGVGEGSIVVDKTGRYLYCYYSNHAPFTDYFYDYRLRMTRRLRNAGNAHLARSRIEDKGMPGTWRKYYEGEFNQPGIGGKSEAVAWLQNEPFATLNIPFVTYIPEWERYIMVAPVLSMTQDFSIEGLHMAVSEDGIEWSEFSQLTSGLQSFPRPGVEYISYPTLVLDTIDENGGTGWLYYAYSEAWGDPYQHHLAGQPITFTRTSK